ncbi:MAG: hypothetical protein FVQ82_08575 [Planctomycetes bacterium]|nr:hypothetical protein [Planctomycetota bacterium]
MVTPLRKNHYLSAAIIMAVCFIVGNVCAAETDYEFYKGSQYPGKELRPGVELQKVVTPGGGAAEYARREVEFWPRKGVDFVKIEKGMPLRTWKLSDGTSLKAHLIGFRGVGYTIDEEPFKTEVAPAVVLRLGDGRKRSFQPGSFSQEDKDFIIKLFKGEMKRIRDASDKTEYAIREKNHKEFPNNAKPGEPGTMQVVSDHFVWVSGSESGSDGDPWVSAKDPQKSDLYRAKAVAWAEAMWSLYEYSGLLMPYWDADTQIKYAITVAGTKRDGYKVIPGYAGGGRGGCINKGASNGILGHEWGHGLRINSVHVGGGEAGADTCASFVNARPKGGNHLRRPSRNIFNGFNGYGYTSFYCVIGDDPNWGYGWFSAMPLGREENSMMHTIARVLEQRGMAENGIVGVGDMVGEYAARLATFDCEMETEFRKQWHCPARNWLECVDEKQNKWQIPADFAPEPFGMNFVRLVADKGARVIEVDFAGIHNPDTYSDWRACLIAVEADGTRRYSNLWSKGKMTLLVKPGDVSHWLSVAATPTALYMPEKFRKGNNRLFVSGRHASRYPWTVRLRGANPGSPHKIKGEYGIASTYREKGKLLPAKIGKQHPNGGGWVADSATVDATAYVGPNAMVLNNAKVLGNARVEDFAVVMNDATLKDNAKAFGGALVNGNAVMEGYSRSWLPAEKDIPVPKLLHKRPGAKELHKHGLWANYAMDRADSNILEDFYRYPITASKGYSFPLFPVLNGSVYGEPKLVTQDERMGFEFGGRGQYATLSPKAIDLGEATIVVELLAKQKNDGTVFDFGTSKNNCMVLKIDKAGVPVLTATVNGKKTVSIKGTKAVAAGKWSQLRVAIDGKTTSLWLGGEKIASAKTTFRPCDVFGPEAVKANLIGNSRDGKSPLAAIFDSVVIYHTVHEDFSLVPAPTTDSPVRPSKANLAMHEKILGDAEVVAKKAKVESKKMMEPLLKFKGESMARREKLVTRHKPLLIARENLANASKDISSKELGALKKDVAEKENEAWLKYLPEEQWLNAFEYACTGRYYNQPYMNYIRRHVMAELGGGETRENLTSLTALVEAGGNQKDWRTEVNWDWRLPEEENGKIENLPLTKAWLLKNRGPVVIENPAGK